MTAAGADRAEGVDVGGAQGASGVSASRAPTPMRRNTKGITYFLIDMASPGIEVRPLREITGDSLFNEVFLDDVFVPDEMVVGTVNDGWRLARTTLANERIAMAARHRAGQSDGAATRGAGVAGSRCRSTGSAWGA